jgi:hypothetical protein
MTTQSSKTTVSVSPGFVPIVTEPVQPTVIANTAAPSPVIEVRLAGAVVRVASTIDDTSQLTAVLRAIRASASRA